MGESRDSKQWAAEGTSGRAEVVRKAVIVKGKALPGRVDEADETPDEHQPQSQQRQLYHKESQHNENMKRNIPSAHGVPLEGEWSVCASGRVRLDSCKDSMGECGCIDKWCWPVQMRDQPCGYPKAAAN